MPRKQIETEPNELRMIRQARRLSQEEASLLVGISRPMWSSWECRARQMTIVQLNAIQEHLHLTDQEVSDIRKWWTGMKPRERKRAEEEEDPTSTPEELVEQKA